MTEAADTPLEDVLQTVRERVEPSSEEEAALEAAVDDLLERTETAIAAMELEADVVHVGSTARGTWLSGDRDIDIFVRFPPDTDRDRLEEQGLAVGEHVLPEGRRAYAEHPYLTGTYGDFDVDLVPCFDVPSATDIRSAVDRTPFHTAYLAERIDDADAEEIRLFKQFLVASGVYGSDLRTRGFSGYLCELLVLHYGGCAATLSAAADWHPPVTIDPADHARTTFDDPLIVIDPTDPERNVAAVVSDRSLARLQHHARRVLAEPTLAAFEVDGPPELDAAAVRDHIDRRGTCPIAVDLTVPGLVDDQLYPQLRRSLRGLVGALEDRGFEVLRSDAFATPLGKDGNTTLDRPSGGDPVGPDRRAILLVELANGQLPAIERHEGPPVHVREHAEAFRETYRDAGADVFGPFIEADRYVVERPREYPTAVGFIEAKLGSVSLGAAVAAAVEDGYTVHVGPEIAGLAETFGEALAAYLDPRP